MSRLHGELSLVTLCDFFHNGEPQATAMRLGAEHSEKSIKDALSVSRINARAIVLNAKRYLTEGRIHSNSHLTV
jgi:hypothetical protein